MKKYRITYALIISNKRFYFDYYVKALCKLHALIKFKISVKHNKKFKREILKISKNKI